MPLDALHDAVEKSGDDRLCVKYSSIIYPKDAHVIDIGYHKHCWVRLVHDVLRVS